MTDEISVADDHEQRVERWGETQFIPGTHVGLVGRLTVALIEAGHSSTRDRLWSLVASDAPIGDVLDELSASGLKSLPSFAVAQADGDDLRVVARGATRVVVTFNDESQQEIDPSDVRTWKEDVFADAARLSLTLSDDGAHSWNDSDDRFFVLAGSVPAVSLDRRFDSDAALAAAAASWERTPRPLVQGGALTPSTARGSDWTQGADGAPADRRDSEPPAGEAGAVDEPAEEVGAVNEPAEKAGSAAERGVESAESEVEPAEETEGAGEPRVAADAPLPPEDSNETISSIDFDDPPPVASTAPRSDFGSDTGASSEEGEENYDFIYGHTVARSVEGAAVRSDEEQADGGGLISAVPGEANTPTPTATAPPAESPLAGDHDGMTVSRADLAAMKAPKPGAATAAVAGPNEVLAVLCGSGHPNPPHAAQCRVCGAVIGTSTLVSVPRPPLGVLVFSNGERVVADRTVLIGRNPRVSGTLTGELPRMVKLESAGQGLSRTHAEVRIEGWQMLLEDLQSTNGTEVTLPGQAPRRLHAGDPVALVAGATVDFGEELQCRVEVVS